MPIKRRQQAGSKGQSLVASDPVFEKVHPNLYEMMTATTFEDGSKRQTSTLNIFVDDGCFKACLNDRAEGQVAFVTDETVQGLLGAVEEQLATGAIQWRTQTGGRKR